MSIRRPQTEISTNIGWIAVTFCTDRCGPQRMNPNDSGDPLTLRDEKCSEISRHLREGLAQNTQTYDLSEWEHYSDIGLYCSLVVTHFK